MIRHSFEDGMYLRQSGDAAVAPVLWIHGLGESGLGFEKMLGPAPGHALASWRHLAPDLPGYGKTPWGEEPSSLPRIANLLAEWLKVRDTPPVVVVGHSMGGVIGQILCEEHPERVRAFFNVEGNISIHDCGFSSKIAAWDEGEFAAGGFGEILAGVYRGGGEDLPLRTYFASMSMCSPRQIHLNSRELVEASREEMLAGRLASLEIPKAYLLGSPRGTGDHSQSLLAAAGMSWHAVENAGHWPFLDQPDEFVAALGGFLAELS